MKTTKDQLSAVLCALADLQGSLQAHESNDPHAHDWKAHQQSIDELIAAFDLESLDVEDVITTDTRPTATHIRNLEGYMSDARLYKLSQPVMFKTKMDGPEHPTLYVVVSATNCPVTGRPETYIFPANEGGEVLDWLELKGSFRGELNHAKAIANAGWRLQ